MVAVAALPVAKLAGLLVKTLSKPMAKRVKHQCSQHEFSKKLLIGLGQGTHILTSRLTIWSAGYQVRSIKPLEPDEALTNGAEFVGESVVFLVAGGVLVYEYSKSKEKEQLKDLKQDEQIQSILQRMEVLDTKINQIEKITRSLQSATKQESPLYNNTNTLNSIKKGKGNVVDDTLNPKPEKKRWWIF